MPIRTKSYDVRLKQSANQDYLIYVRSNFVSRRGKINLQLHLNYNFNYYSSFYAKIYVIANMRSVYAKHM